ncbi:ATP-binding protein [Thermogladius sp. 4427co]|uniref:ATP-binding protein n=1 Tax=Thermogladius sp. 4427co TaxID=3450718 RepID=UPI003F7A6754
MVKCSFCEREAVARIPYARLNLCKTHLEEYLLKKLGKTITRYRMIRRGGRIVVGVSGGVDSVSLADMLDKLGLFKLLVLHINLGIGEYSGKSAEIVKRFSEERGLDYFIIDLRETDLSIPQVKAVVKKRSPCSICGLVKRYILNAFTLDVGYEAVATAHHADDLIIYLIKGFITQDSTALEKLAPVNAEIPGVAARRIKPFYEFYKSEIEDYARAGHLPYIDFHCPFKYVGWMEDAIRDFVEKIEREAPGFKISLLRAHAKRMLQKPQRASEKPTICRSCGLLSSGSECSFCRLTRRILGYPAGLSVRRYIISEYFAGNRVQIQEPP